MRDLRLAVVSLLLVSSTLSCGGAVGEALRPEDHTALGATGAKAPTTCTGVPKLAKPLIVDLDPDARVDLEASMKKGVTVVAYDCVSFRVLSACKVPEARYEYAGVAIKEQVIQMNSLDDLHVNLPISSGKLGAEMKSGRSVDIALVRIGMTSTPLAQITRTEMTGACEGATHFVQNATLGAFSLATGSVGKAAVMAEMFQVGGGAASESERKAMNKDGSLDDCRHSDPDGMAPPPQCRSPLQVELFPILVDAPAGAGKGKKDEKSKSVEAAENPCPEGYSFADDKCTLGTAQAHLCDPKNEVECKEQCGKGNAESCLNLGRLKKGTAGAAMPFYKKACDGGAFDGCGALAMEMSPDDESPNVATEARAALKVAHQGCEGGSGYTCDIEGDYLMDASYKIRDVPAAMKAYSRGCSLGFGTSCWSLAKIHFVAKDVPRDAAKGVELLNKACQAGNADECEELAGIHESGKAWGSAEGLTVNLDKAFASYKRACLLDVDWCYKAADKVLAMGKEKDAFAFADRGCDADDETACYTLGKLYDAGKGVAQDSAKAKETYAKACKAGDGDEDACKKIGVKMKD